MWGWGRKRGRRACTAVSKIWIPLPEPPYGSSGVELSKSDQSDLPLFPSPPPHPRESLLAGNPTYKAFLYPICKGVTSSDVSVFENTLICPSSLKRLALVFLKTPFSIAFSWTSVWSLQYERKAKTRKNIYLVKPKRIKVEPRFNEGLRDCQILFVITRFRYFSLVFYYY